MADISITVAIVRPRNPKTEVSRHFVLDQALAVMKRDSLMAPSPLFSKFLAVAQDAAAANKDMNSKLV